VQLEELEQFQLFSNSIRSEETKKSYTVYLKKYIAFVGSNDLFFGNNPRSVERAIIDFIISLKRDGKSYFAIRNYVSSIISFYKINDVILNTKKISKFIPDRKIGRKDRGYNHEEIHSLLEIGDERLRAVILLLASTGMRIGAIPYLRIRNLEKLDNDIYKITVYENSKEEYFTFTTPECSKATDNYLTMRQRYGEKIHTDSFLIREQFDLRNQFAIRKPTQVRSHTLTWKLTDLSERCGIRIKEELVEGGKTAPMIRKEVAIAHGFRKFFTTQLVNSKVNPEIREMLLGHQIGLSSAYYRPTEEEMLLEFSKVIDNLTIDPANRLQRKVEVLTLEKSKVDLALMQIEEMKKRIGLD
jgi:integrase